MKRQLNRPKPIDTTNMTPDQIGQHRHALAHKIGRQFKINDKASIADLVEYTRLVRICPPTIRKAYTVNNMAELLNKKAIEA